MPPSEGTAALISVVMPCYNQARYLGEAIDSVLSQTHPNVEAVVVDDGSTDATREVATRRAGVRYVRQRNLGLAAARNTGLRESAGEHVVFLDADDRLLPDALLLGAAALDDHGDCAFVVGRYRHIAADGTPVRAPLEACAGTDCYLALLRFNCIGMVASVMFRRSVLVAEGGFDPSLRACEDYDLYFRVTRRFPVSRHEGVVAEYRLHDAGMSRDSARMLAAASTVLRRQRVHVTRDPQRWEAWRAGIAWVEEAYGERLLDEIAGRTWGSPVSVHELAVLLRHYPRGLARRMVPSFAKTVARG